MLHPQLVNNGSNYSNYRPPSSFSGGGGGAGYGPQVSRKGAGGTGGGGDERGTDRGTMAGRLEV